MFPSSLIKINASLWCLLLAYNTATAQLEKVWPTWNQDNGTEFVAIESAQTTSSAIVEYTYQGTDFSMGFYSQNNTLGGTSSFRYGMDYVGSTQRLYVYHNGSLQANVYLPLSVGDVIQIRYSAGRYVFVLAPQGDGEALALRRQVDLGGLTDDGITITSGVGDGDRVVTAGLSALADSQRVALLDAPASPPSRTD